MWRRFTIARGYRKFLSLAGLATVIVAPLGVLGWHSKDSGGPQLSANNSADQGQQAEASQTSDTNELNHQATQAHSATVKSSSSTGSSSSKTTLIVDGQEIPLPASGHIHKVIQNQGGTNTLDVSINNSSSPNAAGSQSFSSVSLDTRSETIVDGQKVNN